jgi:hypothetical protein
MNTYEFNIPQELNGDQLQVEIGAYSVRVVGDKLIIDTDKTQEEVEALVNAHIPAPATTPTIAEKLASVGLSIEELKAALGGN